MMVLGMALAVLAARVAGVVDVNEKSSLGK